MMTAQNQRVVFLCASGSKGGTEQLVRLLAGGLAKRGADSAVLALDSGNAEWLSQRGASVKAVQVMGQGKLLGILKLATALRPWRNAVINIHYPTFDVYRSHFASMKLAGCRNVVASLHHPHLEDKGRVAAVRQEMDQCRSVIVTTPENKKTAEQLGLVAPGKAIVCLPGIEAPTVHDSAFAKQELGLAGDRVVVSTICRLAPEKRVPLLVDAVYEANKTGGLFLAIGGDGPERATIEAYGRAKLGDHFKMLGYVQDPNLLYAASEVYAMLSDLEGFGLA
ncbi:MAG: glycosyltransferase, partial [Chlorobia bacterium]|nr:glycosyltransferase [Fimbriimonadaceae bacterium]